MPVHARSRLVNPLLGTYFGIFGASLVGIVLLLLIFEQMGVAETSLRLLLLVGSLGLYAAIGAAAYTERPSEFLVSGRRVPAFFNGLVLAVTGLGGTGIVALTGVFFLAGFDALAIALGFVAGFVVMVVLTAPFLRKFGAPTLPGYLGRRFESGAVRVAAAMVAAFPLLLLLVAELKIGIWSARLLTGFGPGEAASVLVVALLLTLAPGGVRSLSWSSSAQSLAALFALLVPAAIVAVLVTNLPVPQMSHGPVLRALVRTELAAGLPAPVAGLFTFDLPGPDLQPITGRYLTAFGSIGPIAFVLAMLGIAAGIAGSPALLGRVVTTPSVYETRRALGWTVFIVGIIVLTLSSVAVFLREILGSSLASASLATLPAGFRNLLDMGLAAVEGRTPQLSPTSFHFKRDGVLLALPVLMNFPAVLVHVVTAGILAAALAGAAAALTTLSTIVSEDVLAVSELVPVEGPWRFMTARGTMLGAAVGGGWLAAGVRGDPLDLLLWSLALSGSCLFPIVLLSIWWKRLNALGTLAGLIAGFGTAVLMVFTGELMETGLDGALAAAVAAPVSFVVAILVARVTPSPSRNVLELVRDLRVPGGETLYDREVRLSQQRQVQRG